MSEIPPLIAAILDGDYGAMLALADLLVESGNDDQAEIGEEIMLSRDVARGHLDNRYLPMKNKIHSVAHVIHFDLVLLHRLFWSHFPELMRKSVPFDVAKALAVAAIKTHQQ